MNQILIKCIYMLKIHTKQNIKLLITKRENIVLRHFNDSKSFIKHTNDIDGIYIWKY